jgi:hypothetical protein
MASRSSILADSDQPGQTLAHHVHPLDFTKASFTTMLG